MENGRSMKEEIRFQADYKDIHERAINSKIYRYKLEKYKNILNQETLIRELLEYCRENDKEVKQKYLYELKQLEQEKWIVFNEIKEMDNEEDREK